MATINATAGMPVTLHLDGAPSGVENWQVRVYNNTGAVVVGPALDDLDTITEGVTESTVGPGEVQYSVTLTAPQPAIGYEPDVGGFYAYTDGWMSSGQESEPDVLLVSLTPDLTTAIGRFRLELGDLDASAYLYTDEQAQYFVDKRPTNLLLAVADACDALAARFAPEFDFETTDNKSFKRSQKADHYLAMAKRLRERAALEGDNSGTATLTATDGQIIRVLRSTPATLTATFNPNEIPTAATGSVTVTVTREDSTEVRSAAATPTTATGQYLFALTAADTAELDVLTLSWAATIAGQEQTITNRVEIRGAYLFSIAQARQMIPLNDADSFPTARLVEARTFAELALERECNAPFAPTYFHAKMAGRTRHSSSLDLGFMPWPVSPCLRTLLMLPVRHPTRIASATIDGATVDADEIELGTTGQAYREDGWGQNRGKNVDLIGVHGYAYPTPQVGRACLRLAREYLVGEGEGTQVENIPECVAVIAQYGADDNYAIA